ncbi:MAG: hypothetical protein MZV70_68210 [Desulfobacterales bacterium]|nr:hypothetical protein [Desulfobacterales bacterium]
MRYRRDALRNNKTHCRRCPSALEPAPALLPSRRMALTCDSKCCQKRRHGKSARRHCPDPALQRPEPRASWPQFRGIAAGEELRQG